MLQTLLKFFIPQTLLGYRSQQGDTVKSARDFLYRPAVTGQLLRVLHDLRKLDDTVTIPFRITCAWSCTEDNKEDIVYVEAILPETENVSSEVHVMEKTDTVEGEHKITRFLVCFEDYQKLQVLQKQELENKYPRQNAINQSLIACIDNVHFKMFTANIPSAMHDGFKEMYLTNGLSLNCDDTEEEHRKLLELCLKGDRGA